jgi:predicted dehydrogenase
MTIASPSGTDRLRVGVVGVGYLGRIHAKIYSAMPDVQLVGVCDVNAETAGQVASQHGCEAFRDPAALVGKVDAVSIVTPTSLHLETARPYLDAGVHMLIEKPLAPTFEESKVLV